MPPDGAPPPESPDEGAPLADNPDHAGVLDNELEAAASAAFSEDAPADTEPSEVEPTVAAEGDDEPGEGEGEGGAEGAAPSPVPEAEAVFQLREDLALTREEATQWAEFQRYLQANPEVAQRVAAALEAQEQAAVEPSTASSAPVEREIPEGIDLDDPAIAALWQQHTATLDHIARLEAVVQAHDTFVTQSSQDQLSSMLNQARATYKEKHNLSDAEMQKVYDVAGRLQVLPALLSPVDPVTGTPRQVDQLSAMQEAFELARWNIPELREREMQLKVDEQKTDTKRKQKLSSLGGSSGSTPRTVAEPKNEQERRQAMIAAVAAFQDGEGAE